MKRFAIYIIVFCILTGCKDSSTIKFCEGKAPDGSEVNCGKTFSPGDLTLFVFGKEAFEVDKLMVNVYVKKKVKKEKVRTFTIPVKPDDKNASGDIRLYEEGKYVIDVTIKGDQIIGNGEVKIVDIF